MRDPRQRLLDILDAIQQIELEAPKGRRAYDESPLIQVWMLHHIQIIGEAARGIDPAFRQRHPSIPWEKIIGTRNILIHDYTSVNYDILWKIVERFAPIETGN